MTKAGTRLKSQVCDTQVIVVRSGSAIGDLRAGGSPMVPIDAEIAPGQPLDPALSGGSIMGKRYVDGAGTELLVTKPGEGTLSIGTEVLAIKDAKPLPASD